MRRLAIAVLIALWPALASAQVAFIAPTAPNSDNGDRIATTAWVNNFVNAGMPLAAGQIWIGSAGGIATPQTLGAGVAASLAASLNATGGIISPTPTRAGDIVYWNGSAWVTLAGNNSGTNILQEKTSGGAPSWVPNSGFTAAAKSDQRAGSSNALGVTPLHQQDHDSAAKAWVFFNAAGTIQAGYNVSSVTRASAGIYTVNFSPVAFASINYSCTATAQTSSGGLVIATINGAAGTTSSIGVNDFTTAGASADPTIGTHVHCFGRQ
jgi:hypothetical protein